MADQMKIQQDIKDWKLDDPLPDIFGQFAIGDICSTSDGRKWIKNKYNEWEELFLDNNPKV